MAHQMHIPDDCNVPSFAERMFNIPISMFECEWQKWHEWNQTNERLKSFENAAFVCVCVSVLLILCGVCMKSVTQKDNDQRDMTKVWT